MMKKTILIIIFELIFSGISHSQTIEIVEHLNNKSLNNNANYFECKESISPFENEIAKVDFSIKGDTIYIQNFSDNGFSGVKISFEINSDMKISQMEFYAWDNLKSEIKNKYSVKDYSLKLNKNPFKNGTENIKGQYKISIKKIKYLKKINPDQTLQSKTSYFTYVGNFECK